MKIALLTTDNRQPYRQYDRPEPCFGTAPEALLQGFAALPEVEVLLGIVAHPEPALDGYGYVGTEQIKARYFSADVKGKITPYGYGSPLYSNASCDIELGASSGCVGNTSGITQGTVGAWWRFIHNSYGTMQMGPQYSYTHRTIFQGLGPTPKADENIVMLSFRYYPFQ